MAEPLNLRRYLQAETLPSPAYSFRRWLLLTTSVFQAISPLVTDFGSVSDKRDPVLVPPGPFFAIWVVVIAGCLLIGLWGFPKPRCTEPPFSSIQIPLSLAQVCFTMWCVAASTSRYVALTVPIFAALLGFLARCLYQLRSSNTRDDGVSSSLVGLVLSVYAGWSTPAIWINVATLLPEHLLHGTQGEIVQCGFVTGASAASAIGTYFVHGDVAYTLASGWALIGVIISGLQAGIFTLVVTAFMGLVSVFVVAFVRRTER